MAIQNREFPSIVEYKDFDPGKVAPGDVVIVNILGMHAVYIGTSAGKAARMAEYEESVQIMEKAQQAAKDAEKARADTAVLYELVQRLNTSAQETLAKAVKAAQDTQDAAKIGVAQVEEAAKRACASAEEAEARAREHAVTAESAQVRATAVVESLGDTVRASLEAIAGGTPKKKASKAKGGTK